ncbi:MAG: SusD/RagB family nutrient-binding outer membrane lipoprotein [Bacteroidales bacterium]|jgi:hypothetical protein|nr:SusD/RagB family nutrient-binding outer membrane lipoprotein [Bacteroidales bacterium]
MKRHINNISIALLLMAALLSGCTDKFTEINTDPDNPSQVPADNELAWAEWYISANLYDRWFMLDEPCTFAGYVSKLNYIDEARYEFRAGVQDTDWEDIYLTLNTLRDIQKKASEDGMRNMLNVAKVLEAHVMSIATDRWRDVPYSDAARIDEGILNPTYDTQEEIYPALLTLLKEVADDWADNGEGDDDISGGDLLYGGDIELWQKYANSLRLRLATRISDVSAALAKQTVEEILGAPAKYPVLTTPDENAFFWWDASDASRFEPLADAYRTRPGVEFCAPDKMVETFIANKDPRLSKYFEPAVASKQYRGYVIGAAANAAPANYSHWSYAYEQDLGGFSPWFRAAETWFYIAEAATRGWNTKGVDAKTAYENGITASMEENGVSASSIATYINGAGTFPTGTPEQQRKKIWYEAWVAMFKQGMEGWSIYRRTGVPEFLYVAPGRPAKYSAHHFIPLRSPYPDTERNLNTENNKTFNADVIDDFWGKQMWWDQRQGVNN